MTIFYIRVFYPFIYYADSKIKVIEISIYKTTKEETKNTEDNRRTISVTTYVQIDNYRN